MDKKSFETTTILVSKKTRAELAKLGNKDDTFETIICELIKNKAKKQ